MITLDLDDYIVALTADYIVVNKPPGLPSVPGKNPLFPHNMLQWLQREYPPIYLVHRLDTNTSGVMIFARTRNAQSALAKQFQQRRTEKTYHALLKGELATDTYQIEYPLTSDWPRRPLQRLDWQEGRMALTQLTVCQRFQHSTLVALKPVTGRSHQLRIHCALIGHPIVGCELYQHPDSACFGRFLGPPPVASQRLMLNASQLNLLEPETDIPLSFNADYSFLMAAGREDIRWK